MAGHRHLDLHREEGETHLTTQMKRLTQTSGCTAGHTNELDDQTATNNRNFKNLDS
jgi:hypothetical protein